MENINPIDLAREAYNLAILSEAIDFQAENGLFDADIELDAQITMIQATTGPAADPMVDHLRGMLEISYLDAEDLPEAPPARTEPRSATPGSPNEVFEVRVSMTRAQLDAISSGLGSIAQHSTNRGETRAAEILMGGIPQAYFETSPENTVELADVYLSGGDDEAITDREAALAAMRAVLGDPTFAMHRIYTTDGGGTWRVALPEADRAELATNRYWGREADGYHAEAELEA